MAIPLLAIGAAFSAFGSLMGGASKRRAKRREAARQQRNAAIARDQAAAEILRQTVVSRKVQGSMRAAYGAAGVTVEGSPLDVLEESAANAELDRLTIKYRGELRAIGYEEGAAESRREGSDAFTGGLISAAGSMFSAFGQSS